MGRSVHPVGSMTAFMLPKNSSRGKTKSAFPEMDKMGLSAENRLKDHVLSVATEKVCPMLPKKLSMLAMKSVVLVIWKVGFMLENLVNEKAL